MTFFYAFLFFSQFDNFHSLFLFPTVVFSPYEERQVEKELVLIEEKLISSVAKNEEEIVIGLLRLIKDEKLAERLSSKSQKLMEHSNGKKLLSAVRKLFN